MIITIPCSKCSKQLTHTAEIGADLQSILQQYNWIYISEINRYKCDKCRDKTDAIN